MCIRSSAAGALSLSTRHQDYACARIAIALGAVPTMSPGLADRVGPLELVTRSGRSIEQDRPPARRGHSPKRRQAQLVFCRIDGGDGGSVELFHAVDSTHSLDILLVVAHIDAL